MPRKPGMTREELIGVNAKIVSEVTANVAKVFTELYFEIIANPMDPMTYLTLKKNKFSAQGCWNGGLLDTSRFTYYLRAFDVPVF